VPILFQRLQLEWLIGSVLGVAFDLLLAEARSGRVRWGIDCRFLEPGEVQSRLTRRCAGDGCLADYRQACCWVGGTNLAVAY